MGLFYKSEAAKDAVEALLEVEERFAANLHEEYDTALAVLSRARNKASARVEQLQDIAAVAKRQAEHLIGSFLGE